ncbi:hypothetical protein [Metapseudomonas furukawaii]|jgi:hypothetical protein|uniref:hypothetical protein n=1 Tax=Metapseudomonas furukawaii TaxID=1149133 RepID=UPI00056C4A90|nr:hypothetical protein [Pseudomonas furukawaii]WAG78900.1 hypothetical protein LMK08_26770 [Pseudomonas furukawaii]
MPKLRQHHIFRFLDLLSLVASNAYTACVAGIIAFNSSPDAAALLPVDVLAALALGATLLFEVVAVSLWSWHNHQCNKVLKVAGLSSTYFNRKALNTALSDPVARQRYSEASLNKSSAMGSITLCALLLMASMFVALYLSGTSLTSNGWVYDKFGYAIYAVPAIGVIVFFTLSLIQYRRGLKDEVEAQRWISLTIRPPKSQDIQPGFVSGMVLCRSPNYIDKWGGCYRVLKISQIKNSKYMPPPDKQVGIEWTQFRS